MGLNPKQKLFVSAYLIDQNATRAAIKAGYSKASAKTVGPRLLENVGVKKAIDEGLKKLTDKLDFTALDVVRRVGQIVFKKKFVKDSDVLKGCDFLGKYFKILTDVTQLQNPDGSVIQFGFLAPPETKERMNEGVEGDDANLGF